MLGSYFVDSIKGLRLQPVAWRRWKQAGVAISAHGTCKQQAPDTLRAAELHHIQRADLIAVQINDRISE